MKDGDRGRADGELRRSDAAPELGRQADRPSIDLLVYNAGELLTIAGSTARAGAGQGDLGIIPNGAVAVSRGRIAAVGLTPSLLPLANDRTRLLDASGRVVLPGFVDAHTHVVFAGSREAEFEQRVRGATYQEIAAAGGGILSTVQATRAAGLEALVAQSRQRLDAMLAHGTTTAEVKTGYGLDTASELKMLRAVAALQAGHAVTVVPTFLGAHAVPAEYAGRADDYVQALLDEIMPAVRAEAGRLWPPERTLPGASPYPPPLFCDVFCEEGAFSLQQSRTILESAASLGYRLKIHADEFSSLGGAALAAELGATSADHLVCTSPGHVRRLAQAGVVAVLLPGTTFGLAQQRYAGAREMIAQDLSVALGTDMNPGTCWCESMPFIIALACRYLRLTPAEAIVAATLNGACACGLGTEVGSLEPGKWADILILDLPSHRHIGYRFGGNPVAAIVKRGAIVTP